MHFKLIIITLITIVSTQEISASSLTVFNKTNTPMEVTAIFGSKGDRKKTVTIRDLGAHTFDSSIHPFYELVWRFTNSGVYYTLSIISGRFMKNGMIELKKNGTYIINFNRDGAYNPGDVELGTSPIRYEKSNKRYSASLGEY